MLRAVLNVGPIRPTHHLIAHTAQHTSNGSHPHNTPNDVYGTSAADHLSDREHASTHHTQPSSSRPDNETMQRKRQRMDVDQPSSSRNDAPVNGLAQQKRKRTDSDGTSTPGQDNRINEQHQIPDQSSLLRRDTRVHAGGQVGRQIPGYNQIALSRHNARSDRANDHGQKEGRRDLPSSSRQSSVQDLPGEEGRPGPSRDVSQYRTRRQEMESTPGMNRLPFPCWQNNCYMLPLVHEKVTEREYYRHQDARLNDIWGMYGKEREALAACHTPEPDETWTPVFEEKEIVEHDRPQWEEIWERSVLGGEATMRKILNEDETWPPEAPTNPDIWTREPGGMLSSAVLKQLLRVLTLEASLREDGHETSDENQRVVYSYRPRGEVTQGLATTPQAPISRL